MTERQKAYQEFLKSDFWADIRARCIARDLNRCARCHSTKKLQAHHKEYPADWFQTTLEQLETLCFRCHGYTHGFAVWSSFDLLQRALDHQIRQDQMPNVNEVSHLVLLAETMDERKAAQAIIRRCAELRLGAERWTWWLSRPTEVKTRFWHWSERRFNQLKQAQSPSS